MVSIMESWNTGIMEEWVLERILSIINFITRTINVLNSAAQFALRESFQPAGVTGRRVCPMSWRPIPIIPLFQHSSIPKERSPYRELSYLNNRVCSQLSFQLIEIYSKASILSNALQLKAGRFTWDKRAGGSKTLKINPKKFGFLLTTILENYNHSPFV